MKKVNFVFFSVTTIALILFDLYKSAHASFTHDESWTYLNYVHENFLDILSYRGSYANNHILNTLLMKVFEILFGNSELALRLPNILSHILYLFFTFKFFNQYANKLFLPFFILANANPFLIDFFSLARGYGLAIGLMTAGLYFYCRYLENQKLKNHIFSLAFIGFASLANFALLNIFLILILVHNIFQFFIYRRQFSFANLLRINKINLAMTIFFSIILYEPIRILVKEKLIIVGGKDGFWNDTVNSLISGFAYYQQYENSIAVVSRIFIIVFSALFVFKCIYYFLRKDQINITQKFILFFGMILFFIVLSTCIQNQLLETPFLSGRFALFIYPLFILMSCFLVADILKGIYKYLSTGFLFLISAIFFLHTCCSLNMSGYYEYSYDRDTKKMLADLAQLNPKRTSRIFMGVTWIFAPIINFYRVTSHLDWLTEVDESGLNPGDEYDYVTLEDLHTLPLNTMKIIRCYAGTENCLIEPANKNKGRRNIHLKTMRGKYVSADAASNNIVSANRDEASSQETFLLLQLAHNKYAIYSYANKFLSADLGQHGEITASRDKINAWETFSLIELDSNQVAFKADNEKYLSVDKQSSQLYARSEEIGEQEKFIMDVK